MKQLIKIALLCIFPLISMAQTPAYQKNPRALRVTDNGQIYKWKDSIYYKNLIADSLSLKEKLSNKQNSLIADGTGVKYPTVDAVNSGLGLKANLAGGNIFTGGNQTIEGNLYLPFNRWLGYNNVSPLAPIHIGNRNVLNSSNAQILVAGTYDNSFPTSGHAFSDGTLITGVGSSKAYAGYDGRVDVQGTDVDMDHYVSFQHGPNLNFAGTLKDNFGLYTNTLLQAGNLTNNYGAYLANPIKTGGVMTNNYGIYITNQTSGSNNWSIYSENGFNYFGGSMQIDGTQSLNSTGQNLRIKSDGTNANDGGFYVNSIGNIQVGNWDGTRGFVSLGNGNGYYFGGNFGVKTATPTEALDVSGKALVSIAPTEANGVLRLTDLGTGWAQYTDNVYTSGSPLVINSGSTATIPNNAAVSITNQLPFGVTSLFNPATNKVTPENDGDSYLINVRFTAESSSTTGLADVGIDIGGAMNIVSQETVSLRKGIGNSQRVNIVFDVFSGSTFLSNGGLIKLTSIDGNTSIYDISYKITRTHKAK